MISKNCIKTRTIGKGGVVAVFSKEGISYSLIDYEMDQESLIFSIKEKINRRAISVFFTDIIQQIWIIFLISLNQCSIFREPKIRKPQFLAILTLISWNNQQ